MDLADAVAYARRQIELAHHQAEDTAETTHNRDTGRDSPSQMPDPGMRGERKPR